MHKQHLQNNSHHYEKGKVLPCIITIHIHGSPLPSPKCCQPPCLISYQQMIVVLIVETGVIFVLFRQQRLIMLHHHKNPIGLYPIRVYPLHSQVVIPVVLMLHNHKIDLLMMDNMLLVMDVYRNQPPDISRDIDYEH